MDVDGGYRLLRRAGEMEVLSWQAWLSNRGDMSAPRPVAKPQPGERRREDARNRQDRRAQAELEIRAMRLSVEHLAQHCHGDERPDSPILEDRADVA